MADPSSNRVRPNSEFRERLLEKVHVNVTEAGKLAQQLIKGSRSHEILSQSTKQFVNQESSLVNSHELLKESGKIIAHMEPQFRDIQHSLQTVNTISEQLEPVWSATAVRLIFQPDKNISDIQWNLDFTIWQGDSKIISSNRDIVVNKLQIYK